MAAILTSIVLAAAASPQTSMAVCSPPPPLSYAPWDVGWIGALLAVIDLVAGVACIGIVGSALRWSIDDRAPLRPLWMALILLGFTSSAVGLYIGFANRAHEMAIDAWYIRAAQVSAACLKSQVGSANIVASSASFSIELGVLAIVLIAAGIGGAWLERRRGSKSR